MQKNPRFSRHSHPSVLWKCLMSAVLVAAIVLPVTVAASGNDFVGTDWRNDTPNIYNAGNYFMLLAPGGYVTNQNNDFTTGWLGLDLSSSPGTVLFSQVGTFTQGGQVFWFVYTEAGADCFRGSSFYGTLGCRGAANDLVGSYQTSILQIAKSSDGYYYCFIYGPPNGQITLLARIRYANAGVIYRAQFSAEEGYNEFGDPLLPFEFYFNHPKYSPDSVNSFDWTGSAGGCTNPNSPQPQNTSLNCLWNLDITTYRSVCPRYIGGIMNWGGDPRLWYAGISGNVCIWTFY